SAMRSFRTKEIAGIRQVFRHFPRAGGIWLAGAAAITGAPIFALFLSEITIMRGGMDRSYPWAVYAMGFLLVIVFIGFLNHFRAMYFEPSDATPAPSAISAWCVAPMALAIVPLVIFGFWWPQSIWTYFGLVHGALTGAAR
ncbi:MAG TPA: hypothetical protein VMU37_11130, partial [Caulobacteraceae bacterium]|nr:hypothetical protein [Caulobacteraceae bacterium]